MNISNISTQSSIEALVAQYMALERRPVTELETARSDLNVKLAVYRDLQSKLKALKTAAHELAITDVTSIFSSKTTTSSVSSILTATASSTAACGTHSILVTQLAKSDTIVSNKFTNTATSIVSSEGTGTKTFRITVNGTQTDVWVTINAGDSDETVLTAIVDAINDSEAEVSASVVHDSSSTSRLVISSSNTGSTYEITLEDVSGTLLNTIGADDNKEARGDNGGYIYNTSELTANFVLDGIDVTSDSNTITNVLTGVTITLLAFQDPSDNPVTLTISQDTDAIKSEIESFLSKFNDVITYLSDKIQVDATTGARGSLAGQFIFIDLRQSLRRIAASPVSSVAEGNPSMLSEIGIKPASDGTLSITDNDDFEDAIASDVSKVSDLFNSANGIANQVDDLLEGFVKVGGIIDNCELTIDTQIRNIDNRIDRWEDRLFYREQTLRQQLTQLQELLATLLQQQQAMQNFSQSFMAGFSL